MLFLDHVKYRDLVLESLSLVDASLPELHLMNVDLLTLFLRNVGMSSEGRMSVSMVVSPVGSAHIQFPAEGAAHPPTLNKKVRSHVIY